MKQNLFFARIFIFFSWIVTIPGCSLPAINQPTAEATNDTHITKTAPNNKPLPTVSSLPFATITTSSSIFITSTPITPNWEYKDNWPSANQIRAMIIDSSGDLWTGGPGGVVHWFVKNGERKIYTIGPEKEGSQVTTMALAADQSIWVGTFGNGISHFNGESWQLYTSSNGTPSNYISDLVITKDERLWVNISRYNRDGNPAESRFVQFDGNNWSSKLGGGFQKMISTDNDKIWALASWESSPTRFSSIGYFDGTRWNVINSPADIISTISSSPDGSIWAATDTGIIIYDGHEWQKIKPPWVSETKVRVSVIAFAPDDTVWFGFSHNDLTSIDPCGHRSSNEEWGVYHYDGQTWTHFTADYGLLDNKICAIRFGPDESVWFGTYDKGVSRFDGKTWSSYVVP